MRFYKKRVNDGSSEHEHSICDDAVLAVNPSPQERGNREVLSIYLLRFAHFLKNFW